MNQLRTQFLLDPDITFLNHGSFGATPRPVFEVYQQWQRRLERQPVAFLGREIGDHLAAARQALGAFVNSDPDDLVYVPNATFALNIVARSLDLGPGDEVLTSDHEYGACNNVWRFLAGKQGFRYVESHVPLPLEDEASFVARLWEAVTPATRVIFLSQITSTTAQTFPVAAVCARARREGILTVIDAAHALGQVDLDLDAIGADFYFSNAHKWLCAPKGAAFLYARREKQALLEPLVVGWGWGPERSLTYGSDFLDFHQWLGTNDLAAYLSVPAAIAFQRESDWPAVRRAGHALLGDALARIGALTGLPSAYADESRYVQLAVAPLPQQGDLPAFQRALYDAYRVEIPCTTWDGRQFIRVSIQGYNDESDVDALLGGLQALLAGRST